MAAERLALVCAVALAAIAGCVDPQENRGSDCRTDDIVTGGGAGGHSSTGQEVDTTTGADTSERPIQVCDANATRSGEADDEAPGSST